MLYKLGKKDFVKDSRDLLLAKYLLPGKLPKIPNSIYPFQSFKGDWGMLGNDQLGDCVFAGAGHEHLLWNSEINKQVIFPTQNIIDAYSAVTGYNPSNPDSDNGTITRDALKYRQQTGIKDSTGLIHKISAFAQIDPKNINEVKAGIFLFNAIGVGIQFPEFAMTEFQDGQAWDLKLFQSPKIGGGHYIPVVGFDEIYLYLVTWGKLWKMTYRFFTRFIDEVYGLISEDFINSAGVSPEGFNLKALNNDLNLIQAT